MTIARYEIDDETLTQKLKEVLEDFFGNKEVPENPNEYDVTDEVEYGSPLEPVWNVGDPVGIEVINDKPLIVVERGSVSWGGQSTMVTPGTVTTGAGSSGPQLIVGKNLRRRTVVIVNNGALSIALAPSTAIRFPTAASPFGSPVLPAGAAVILNTRSEVYAVSDPSSTGELISVWETYDDGD